MSNSIPIDTDVLLKIAAWQLGGAFIDMAQEIGVPGTLELTHLIAARQMARMRGLVNPEVAQEELSLLLSQLERLEPSDAEIALASEFEECANQSRLPFDRGESQLLAIVFVRQNAALITGDKRAIASLSSLLSEMGKSRLFRKCMISLEQVIFSLVSKVGIKKLQELVCAENDVDKAISICMRYGRQPNETETHLCLQSYIDDINAKSSEVLVDL